jgi:hypothetical protein
MSAALAVTAGDRIDATRHSARRRAEVARAAALAGAFALAGHGLIHLMGVALFWRLGQAGELRYADALPAAGSPGGIAVGGLWLLAATLFLAAAVLLLGHSARWLPVAAAAAVVSVPAVLSMAAAAGAGLVADAAVLVAVILAWWFRRADSTRAPVSRVPGEAWRIRQAWLDLAVRPAPSDVFAAELVAELPEPAQRWLIHAIPAGTPLWRTADVTMSGEIKLGAWRRFSARQIVAPDAGYVWAATAWVAGLPVRGFDRFSSGTGEMRWRMLGLFPVVTARGPDVSRSAAGRLVSEIVISPTAFRAATWTSGRTKDHVVGTWLLGGEQESVELEIGESGQVTSALISRWGNPDGQPFGRYPFGCTVHSERDFHGVRIPATISAGWWWGTDRQAQGEFFRARITAVVLR